MSLTGQIITTTLTSISAATTSADPLGRPLIPPDAIRFFIIAATVCVFFGSVTCACCISYRVRKARMRRVVIAAFEQGIFDRETVQQRMAYMRRGDPNVNILFPVSNSQIPEYFDKLGKPIGLDKVDRYRDVENLNLQDTIFLPLSAQVRADRAEVAELQPHPHLSLLPLEKQLALLFHVSRTREEKRLRRAERDSLNDASLITARREPELALSVLVSMPQPEGGDVGELVLGTTSFPWRFQVVAEPRSQTIASTEDAILAPGRV